MAITQLELVSLFRILDVPMATSYFTLDGMGSLSAQTNLSSPTQTAAATTIRTYVNNIDNDPTSGNPPGLGAGSSTILATDLDNWEALSSSPTVLINGAIGDISGINDDVEKERKNIEERVRIMVPFYKFHEVLARQAGSGSLPVTF